MQFDYSIFHDVVRACRDVYPNWMRFSDVCLHVPRRSRQQIGVFIFSCLGGIVLDRQ